jgi:polyferredoxin
MVKYAGQALKFQMRRRKLFSIFCEKMVVKIVKIMLFSVLVALAEYSLSAEYTAETFGRSHFRLDTTYHAYVTCVTLLPNLIVKNGHSVKIEN